MALHDIPCEDVAPDPSNDTEQALQNALIELIPTPEEQVDASLLNSCGNSPCVPCFLLDMVLPQLDAYNAGRHMQ